MTMINPLPFELTDESIDSWLYSLSSLGTINAGDQLNKAVNQLRKIEDNNALIFPVLIKLTPTILHLSNALATTVRHQHLEKPVKVAKLSLQLFRNLGLAFHSLIHAEALEMEQKQEASYYALQITGQYHSISYIFNEMTSETLWKKSAELYRYAVENKILRQELTIKIPEFKLQPSIEAVLKRNILLTLCCFRQLSSSDNQALYLFINRYFYLLELVEEQRKNCFFYWNLKNGIPCQTPQPDYLLSQNQLFIDTGKLIHFLQTDHLPGSLNDNTVELVLHHLSGYQKLILDTIPSAPIIFNMLSGLPAICDFLNEREKLIRIHKLSSELTEQQPDYEMSLAPLDYQRNFFSNADMTLDKMTLPPIKMGQAIKCLKTNNENYLIAECKNTVHFNGELVIFINNKNAVIAGIIRQQRTVTSSKTTQFLIEKIQGQLTPHSINSEQRNDKMFIVIDEASTSPEVLLTTARYHNGSTMKFNNKTARLISIIEYSPHFVRYRISFDP